MLIAELPTGTVTFLFTDIEGSTRLWEEHPSAMRPALAQHDELIAEAVAANDGHLIKSTGDGAYAVFDRAVNAAAAAVEAQQRFQEELFPDVGHLRVRMALHTGEADERQGDYFGPALNRAARLLGTGHGGQILVSAAAWEVLGESEYDFVDLGEHRLRDLTRPERVHQLTYRGLPSQFAPLVSVDAHPNNLPLQLTSFVGRDQEVLDITILLGEHRLVSLTGVGGAGKTRLALQVASEFLDSSPDGAWFVELAPISNPGLVISQTAAPFGVREIETDAGRLLIDVLSDYLSPKDLLLVLDNCEHVIEEAARLSEELLTRCPDLKILATSRGLLGVPGETLYPVPPLGVHGKDPDGSEDTDAVLLFAERAAHVQPGFRLDDDNSEAVRQITQRLEGLPLAIELAASRTNVLTPSEILNRLDDQLRLITSKRRGGGRHSTLEAAMDWSYDLLSPTEQSLFGELSVFAGGWSLEAADAVTSSDEDVLEALGQLVDQSLVEVSDHDVERRYRLLEPVRQYAAAKLTDSGGEHETRRRHAEYFVTLGEQGDAALKGPDQDRWSLRLRSEHDNMRSAIEWSLQSDEHELALRLTSSMGWFWWLRGHWKEAYRWFRRVYDVTSDADPVLRGRLVYKVASLEIQRARPGEVKPLFETTLAMFREKGSDIDVAWTAVYLAEGESTTELARESLDLFASLGESWGEAYARFTYGQEVALASDEPEGLIEMERAIDDFLDLGDRWTAAWMGFNLGLTYVNRGEYDRARRLIEQSADLVKGTTDRWIAPHCKSRLGILATMTGASEEAKALFDEALPVHQRIGDQNCTALIHTYMGELLTDEGDYAEAADRLTLSLKGYQDLQNRYGMARSVRRMGWLAVANGELERGARLLGAADGFREDVGGSISVHDDERNGDLTATMREQLDPAQLDEWWAEGKAMSRDERVSYALGGRSN